ncbi:hypothetical protein F5884DRAFT_76264 [Xylogone sp. PMI_703]|nr:hypothetical protein F5884DRAFT_76264 [Xylogone sp. PMI_703]
MSSPPNNNAPPRSSGLSLYANLLDPDSATTPSSVSRGPVIFKAAGTETAETDASNSAKKPPIDAAALRFQPTRRPQLSSQKPKPKSFPKAVPPDAAKQSVAPVERAQTASTAKPPPKSTLADWTALDDDDVNGFYGTERRQRGGRKRRKKNKEERPVVQDWDDIYDPTRPNIYEEYKHSDERIREMREWKDRLYAHRMRRKPPSDEDSDEDDYRPQMNAQFAPPPEDGPRPVPPPPADVEDDQYSPAPPPPPVDNPPPPPATASESLPAGSISRAPVRYNLPPAPSELPKSERELEEALAAETQEDEEEGEEENGDASRSLRPGQKGFAERLMAKYGWSKGKGLGADESGIVNALQVKVEKRKKKSDAEGGGFRDPGGRGKIIGGKKSAPESDSGVGKFGPMSEVIVLRGMVDGMDLNQEVEGSGDGGLMQEIGDECSEKVCISCGYRNGLADMMQYGRVERVYIDRDGNSPKVFVKFTSQLSALRAVNALEGRMFNGNTIAALFYDSERFEQGIYK